HADHLLPLESEVRRHGGQRGEEVETARRGESAAQAARCRPGSRHSDGQGGRPKEMVKPAGGRRAVGYLLRTFGVSERRACKVIGLCRSSYRFEPRREEPMEVLQEFRQIASERPRFGYRRLHALL